MEMADLWSGTLTFALGFVGFILRGYVLELNRLQILLNRTREEYVTNEPIIRQARFTRRKDGSHIRTEVKCYVY